MGEIKREDVSSSNIRSIGYDPEKKILCVEFTTGAVYDYSGVEQADFDAFKDAESKGKHFHSFIKGRFDFKRA